VLDLALMSKSAGTLQALMQHLATDRVLLEGSTQRSGVSFARIGDTVIRVSSEVEKQPVIFNWAQNMVRCVPDRVSINIAAATLAELLDCQRDLEKNGSGEARVRIAEFIAHVRQEAQQKPLEIRVVNPEELRAPDKVISVKRNDSGKMTGAVVTAIP
jgi:hypothetical protein